MLDLETQQLTEGENTGQSQGNFLRLAESIYVAPILSALSSLPHLWSVNTARQTCAGSPHHDTESIWLRGPEELTVHSVFHDVVAHDYPSAADLSPAVVALLAPLIQSIQATELGRVMIVNLKPGGKIDLHADEGVYAEHYSRFHLVLSSNSGNTFTCGEESVHMKPGEFWWFNHQIAHTVSNDSDSDRIHIIVDAVTPLFETVKMPMLGLKDGIYEMPYDFAIKQVEPLLAEHWDEVAKNKHLMVLKPDHETYRKVEREGNLLILCAYRNGSVVGYSCSFIYPHMHYSDLSVCSNDVLFVHKDHRNSPVGLQLIRKTEKVGSARGARLMLWHAKPETPLDKIMQRMRYGVQDIIYSKEI